MVIKAVWHRHKGEQNWPKNRLTEYNLKSINKTMHLWLIDFWQGCQDNSIKKEQSFWWMVLGQMDVHQQINEIGPLIHTIYDN